jgi:hypothetical protein
VRRNVGNELGRLVRAVPGGFLLLTGNSGAALAPYRPMAKRSKQQTKTSRDQRAAPTPRWQIESGTRGVYVGSKYAERTTNWPLFTWSPSEGRIIRFDDKAEAEAELARVQSFAANARLREVDV